MFRNFCQLLAVRMEVSKMAEVDGYLDYSKATLEQMVQQWSTFGDGHCLSEWRFLKSLLEL